MNRQEVEGGRDTVGCEAGRLKDKVAYLVPILRLCLVILTSFFCLDLAREAQLSVRGGGGAGAGPLESPSLAQTCRRTSGCDANPDRVTPGASAFNDAAGKQGWSEAYSSPPLPWKLPRAERHSLRWSNQAYVVFRP